jgi:hypothetical protein
VETYKATGSPGVTLARLAKPSTTGTGRELHGTPKDSSRREMRQFLVGSSITLGALRALRAGALGDAAVGMGETDPVLEGSGGVEGLTAEQAAVASRASTARTVSSRRVENTPVTIGRATHQRPGRVGRSRLLQVTRPRVAA